MNLNSLLLESSLFDVLGSVFIETLWQGMLIALVVWVMFKIVPRDASHVRYAIGVTALIAMLAIPMVAIWQGYASLEGVPVYEESAVVLLEAESLQASPQLPAESEAMGGVPEELPMAAENASTWALLRSVLGFIWIAGLLIMVARLCRGWLYVHRWRNDAVDRITGELEDRFKQLLTKIVVRQEVALLQSAKVTEAILVGWIKPAILLPVSVVTEMSTDHIEAIIAHELAHVKRYDHIVAAVQALIETILFFHPGMWWISHQVRIEREHCCDDLAVQILEDKPRYARALLELETQRSPFKRYALSANDGSLLTRIRRLMSAKHKKRTGSGYTVLMTVFVFVIGWQVGSCDDPPLDMDNPLTMEQSYDLPAHVQLMIDANDIEGTVAYLHDQLTNGRSDILDLAKAVYIGASERRELRRNMVYVFGHINTPEADHVLMHIAENDMLWEVRANAVNSISKRIKDESEAGFEEILREQLGEKAGLYEYPTIGESQLKALVPALRRIGLDNMQMPGVRRAALGALRNRPDIPGYFERVVATSTDPYTQLSASRYLKPADKRADTIIGLYESSDDAAFKLRTLQEVGFSGSLLASSFLIDHVLQADDGESSWLAMDGLNSLYFYLSEDQYDAFFATIDGEVENRLLEMERAALKGYASPEDKAVDLFKAKHVHNILGQWRRRFPEHNFNAFETRANAIILELTEWREPQEDRRFDQPLFEFTTDGATTQLYANLDKSSRQMLRLFEHMDIRRYLAEELKAGIVANPIIKTRSASDRIFAFTIELEGYLWNIEVKALAPYKYGVMTLSKLEDHQIDMNMLQEMEDGSMGFPMFKEDGKNFWWVLGKGPIEVI